MAPTPLADAALDLLALGWHPLPLPPRAKSPVPRGVTGHAGVDLSDVRLKLALRAHPDGNVAIRMPVGVIGIDVDTYGPKLGALQLLDYAMTHGLPELPPTYASTSRDPAVSAIRYYRLPTGAVSAALPPQVPGCPHVDVIRREHRYAVAPPSIHPDTGEPYRWIDPTGAVCAAPAPASLAVLPQTWYDALVAHRAAERPQDAAVAPMTGAEAARVRAMLVSRLSALADDEAALWDNSCYSLACDLVRLSNSTPDLYPIAAAREDYLAYAPKDAGFDGSRRNGKFDRAIEAVGDARRAPGAASDFEALPEDAAEPQADEFADLRDRPLAALIAPIVTRDVRPLESGGYAVWRGHTLGPGGNVRHQIVAIGRAMERIAIEERKKLVRLLDMRQRREREAVIDSLYSDHKITAVRNQLVAAEQMDDAVFDGPDSAHLLSCANGVIDLRTGKLITPKREQFISRHTPVEYRPGASHEDWTTALTVLPDDTWKWLRPRFGQMMFGEQPTDNRVLVFTGEGANGKSTLVTGVARALGSYAVAAKHEIFTKHSGPSSSIMRLKGARYVFVEELPDRVNPDSLKALSSYGTEITGRELYRTEISWLGTHSLIITANTLPRISASDDGAWRRLVNVQFQRDFTAEGNANPDLIRRLYLPHQQQAILAWLVESAVLYFADPSAALRVPVRALEHTLKWRELDSLAVGFVETCLCEGGPEDAMLSSTLQALFNGFDPAGTRRSARTIYDELRREAKRKLPSLELNVVVRFENCQWAEDGIVVLPTTGTVRAARGVTLSPEGRILLERLRLKGQV